MQFQKKFNSIKKNNYLLGTLITLLLWWNMYVQKHIKYRYLHHKKSMFWVDKFLVLIVQKHFLKYLTHCKLEINHFLDFHFVGLLFYYLKFQENLTLLNILTVLMDSENIKLYLTPGFLFIACIYRSELSCCIKVGWRVWLNKLSKKYEDDIVTQVIYTEVMKTTTYLNSTKDSAGINSLVEVIIHTYLI